MKSFLSGKITCPSTIKLDTFAKKCENSTDMRGNNLGHVKGNHPDHAEKT